MSTMPIACTKLWSQDGIALAAAGIGTFHLYLKWLVDRLDKNIIMLCYQGPIYTGLVYIASSSNVQIWDMNSAKSSTDML